MGWPGDGTAGTLPTRPRIGRGFPGDEEAVSTVFWSKAFARDRPVSEPGPEVPPSTELAWRDPLVDVFLETYVEWREECQALERAYRRWVGAQRSGRDVAFATYRAALDREEQAARVYGLVATGLGALQRE